MEILTLQRLWEGMILKVQQNNKQVNTCEEHVDLAFDDFLVKYETFPLLNEIKDVKCSYCEKDAVYVLKISNEEGVI